MTLQGVRGSVPTPSNDKLKYGGNTTCIFVNAGGHPIIIDGGTGILNCNQDFSVADILLSHLHHDHINGLPLFKPFFNKDKKFAIYGEKREGKTIKQQLSTIFKAPYFPVNIEYLSAQIEYKEILQNQQFSLYDDVLIKTMHSNHPNTCTAFKIIHQNKSVVTLLDHEHQNSKEIDDFVRDCDLLIYDSHFCEDDYVKGWGHSTWKEGVELAKRCHVKQLILSHHNPEYTDDTLNKLQASVSAICDFAQFAVEGETIYL